METFLLVYIGTGLWLSGVFVGGWDAMESPEHKWSRVFWALVSPLFWPLAVLLALTDYLYEKAR